MDPKLYPGFLDEATSALADARRALLFLAGTDSQICDLKGPTKQVHALGESAAILGLSEPSQIAFKIGSLLDQLKQIAPENQSITISEALDLIAKLECYLLKASLDDDNFSLDIDEFIDQSFGLLESARPTEALTDFQASDNKQTARTAQSSANDENNLGQNDFEIDDELLEIFAEEAEDLLRNIEQGLSILAENPSDSDVLWEIRRNAHTFKGSAGIVGLKNLSEIAHKIEDLLDSMNESGKTSGDGMIDLLHEAARCLRDLIAGQQEVDMPERISMLYSRFAAFKTTLSVASITASSESDSKPESLNVTHEEPHLSLSSPLPTIAELFTNAIPSQPTVERRPALRSVVRISLTRLDELVALVRAMIVSRSFYEQQIKDFEHQLEELQNATRRLQATSNKLEIDFEASMLGSDLRMYNSISRELIRPRSAELNSGFDDLEFDRYTDFHQSTRELAETSGDVIAITTSLDSVRSNLGSHFDEQRRVVDELQDELMRIRMVEFGSITTRLQRAVRVTCEEEGKHARLSIVNEKLEVDTQILDSLIEPLIHLLKNAVVHGIEAPEVRRLLGKPEVGTIEVSVSNEETHIRLSVSDDGRGISPASLKAKAISVGLLSNDDAASMSDEEALNLIFLPGLTTAEKLNLNAGRGVGMSIVKESVESRNGTISIATSPQRGTRFTIRMPLKLAVTKILLVKAGEQTLGLPFKQIKRICGPEEQSLEKEGSIYVKTPDGSVPVIDLGKRMNAIRFAGGFQPSIFVIVNLDGREYAIGLDDILRAEEVVIKPLLAPVSHIREFLGAAIIGNGMLVPIFDVPNFLGAHLNHRSPENRVKASQESTKKVRSVMIVDDSPSVRHLTKRIIESAGWQALCAKDGLDALEQLRAATERPAVVLTDVEMPRMNGYELCSSLRKSELFSCIPVVMITSRSAEKHRQRAAECGVTHYLTKPFADAELVNLIRKLSEST